MRKINFLKVRTVLRGTVKSVTNVWKKLKKNKTLIYTCLRVTRGVIFNLEMLFYKLTEDENIL